MRLTENALRSLTRNILKELMTKKNPFSTQNVLEPGRGGGAGGGYYGGDDVFGYDELGYDDGWADDGGDFGEADEKLENELTEDEEAE